MRTLFENLVNYSTQYFYHSRQGVRKTRTQQRNGKVFCGLVRAKHRRVTVWQSIEQLGHSDEATGTAMEMQNYAEELLRSVLCRKCSELLSIGSAQSRQAEQRNCEAGFREAKAL